jgi:probable F420-dependent oxidoreductase
MAEETFADMSRPLRVGVQLPEVERVVPWTEYAAMARAAEEVGFDSVWLGDHLLYRDERGTRGPRDAWTLMAGLATATERVRLGTLVACLAFHPPGILARMAATVDELSAGRLALGVGAGWNRTEFEAFGIPFDHRAERFAEAFGIVHRLLNGETVTFHGRFHDVDEAVLLPAPNRHVPIMIGSLGERVLRTALPHVDAWNVWYADYDNSAEGFALQNDRVSSIANDVGRDPADVQRSACVLVVVDRSSLERPLDEVPAIEGSPTRIADALRALADAGADETILVVNPITERSIRVLGDALAALG